MSSTSSALDDAVAALRELILAGEQLRAVFAAAHDLGVRESAAVSHLHAHGAMSQRELSGALHLTPGSVTALVDRLEHKQLARRVASTGDRRITVVELTARAKAATDAGNGILAQCLRDTADGTGAAATELLNGLARAMTRAVRNVSD